MSYGLNVEMHKQVRDYLIIVIIIIIYVIARSCSFVALSYALEACGDARARRMQGH